MKVLVWLMRGIVFVALFGLAIKNSGPVDLRMYLGGTWQVPLSVVILVSFVVGTAGGLTVAVARLVRQSRELRRLRRQDEPTEKAVRS
jgi:lipopolysaccharide assembly protein A